MPVLMQAFPTGLDKPGRDLTHEVRVAYEAWTANQQLRRPDPAIHTAWVRYVLRTALEMPDEAWAEGQAIPETIKAILPEHRDVVRPDLMLVDPSTGAPRLLIQVYPASQGLEKPLPKRPASPVTRTMELLYATGVRLGLLTNGEQWILVHAQRGEATDHRRLVRGSLAGGAADLAGFLQLDRRPHLRRARGAHAGGSAGPQRQGPARGHRPAWLPGAPGGRDPGAGHRSGRPGPRRRPAGRHRRGDAVRGRADGHDAAGGAAVGRGAGPVACWAIRCTTSTMRPAR